jgi:uncharacterized protein (DUF2267 family)
MADRATRQHARRVFEDTLETMRQRYVPERDVMVDATMPGPDGRVVVLARYKLYTDGHYECFEVLDDVLWPSLGQGGQDGGRCD